MKKKLSYRDKLIELAYIYDVKEMEKRMREQQKKMQEQAMKKAMEQSKRRRNTSTLKIK